MMKSSSDFSPAVMMACPPRYVRRSSRRSRYAICSPLSPANSAQFARGTFASHPRPGNRCASSRSSPCSSAKSSSAKNASRSKPLSIRRCHHALASVKKSALPRPRSVLAYRREHADRGAIDVLDHPEIDDEAVGIGGVRHQLAHDRLDRRELEHALQVVEAQVVSDVAQMLGGRVRAAPLRRDASPRGGEADGGHRALRRVEQVQSEIGREFAAHGDAPNAVALRVEARRKHADAEPSGLDREDAAADAALRRQSGVVHPFAREVVHAAGRHHRQDVVHVLFGDGARPRDRIHAAVRERGADQREIAAGDADRALPEVGFERRGRILLEDREVPQHPGNRAVAVPGRALGRVDLLVDVERTAGIARKRVENARRLLLDGGAGDEPARGDCTSIDQRIARSTSLGLEADRVEGVAGRLDPDPAEHRGLTSIIQREPVGERLGHRLDREGVARIADLVHVPVARGDADAEPVRFDARKLRDVVGDLTVRECLVAGANGFQVFENWRGKHCGAPRRTAAFTLQDWCPRQEPATSTLEPAPATPGRTLRCQEAWRHRQHARRAVANGPHHP